MAKHSFIQRLARATFVGLCAAMAIGVGGAASVRAMDRGVTSVERNDATKRALPAHSSASLQVRSTAKVSRVVRMEVTGYCACTKCCGPKAQGITASGKRVSHDRGRFVAADTRLLPFGTKVSVPGYHSGRAVEVIDKGGAIKGKKLDLYFPTHQAALQWGRQHVDVTVYAE